MPNDSTLSTPTRGVFATTQSLANGLELIRKVTISLAVIVGIGVLAIVVVREVFREGIIIDPVIVQLPEVPGAPLPDLVAQQVARNIDVIQRAGVSEWRKLYVDQSTNTIDLQVPGAPITLKASIREIASLFGVRQPRLRISIVIRRDPAQYFASIAVLGRPEARSTCKADDTPAGIDEILRCIALRAVGHIDPKVAAVYAFRSEEDNCSRLDAALGESDRAIREKQRINSLRERCSFGDTQGLIAKMLKGGDPAELPWVSYVFGRIHLARAAALAGIDHDQQLAELDQAIDRFREAQTGLPSSPTALTILVDTQIRRGVALHESAKSIYDSKLQKWRLQLADWAFKDAEKQLQELPQYQDQPLRVLVRRFYGKLIYLQWMLKAQQQQKGVAGAWSATSGPGERERLRLAADHYAWAVAYGPQSAELFVEWGNVLHAIGNFNEAAEKFRRAAEFSPDDPKPWLNIAVAHLDRINDSGTEPALLDLLIALGASTNYLGWSSKEEPSSEFTAQIRQALGRFGIEDAESFSQCVEPGYSAPDTSIGSGIERSQAIATLKACVDQAIDRINRRNIDAFYSSADKKADR
jgi:tetratricopeptide (TPR) repeat protein